jgi:Domain of unknown function (DUF2383)
MNPYETGAIDMSETFAISSDNRTKVVDQLNSLLQGELSAVETYRIAIEKMGSFSQLQTLTTNLASHKDRVGTLRRYIQQLGAEAETTSGAWGAFAKLVENGAALLGENAAISALEEGEDKGVSDYRNIEKLEPSVARFVSTKLMNAQLTTHSAMSALKRARS